MLWHKLVTGLTDSLALAASLAASSDHRYYYNTSVFARVHECCYCRRLFVQSVTRIFLTLKIPRLLIIRFIYFSL